MIDTISALGLGAGEILSSGDGFRALTVSISRLLERRGIYELPGEGNALPCALYYDDWYPFSLASGVWGLLKLREQEHDGGDSDDPGVTVSFVDFDISLLVQSLSDPEPENLAVLRRELHRVTAQRGQRHHEKLKAYFLNPASRGSYLIGEMYMDKLCALAAGGSLPLPENCRKLLAHPSGKRLARFLAALGEDLLPDGIRVSSPPTRRQRLAVLAAHTGNTSLHSFAAEIRFHAAFLVSPARLTLPGLGRSLYGSALRADMAIRPREWSIICPYYRENSHWVRSQKKYHGE